MRLTDLEPKLLKVTDGRSFKTNLRSVSKADGILLLCPKCFEANGGRRGTHAIICWKPHVPLTILPKPGRWSFEGTSLDTLTLVAGSSSILLTSGCGAHFWIRNGDVVPCGPGWS